MNKYKELKNNSVNAGKGAKMVNKTSDFNA